MVSYLTIAMAKAVQIHICHILASIGWHLLWPWCQNNLILQKKIGFSFFSRIKKGEGSLHLRPKGRSIRDPLHSLCNKNTRQPDDAKKSLKELEDIYGVSHEKVQEAWNVIIVILISNLTH